jgi:signal transduction histidine kinase
MRQVLQNLIRNAVQAMPEGGTLRIAARSVGAGLASAQPGYPQEVPLQEFIEISVCDTGEGICAGNMDKLFLPLFTTRSRGIGLGLALSRKYTEANGGRIDVESEPGEGTTFTITLPAKV